MEVTKNITSTILLVDDCRFTRRAISKAIEASLPGCQVVCVESLGAAQAAGAEMDVDLFIVEALLPDGSGIDFLADMVMVHGKARAIVMTDGALPRHVEGSVWFDDVHVLRKAINRAQLLRILGEILDQPVGNSGHGSKGKELWSARLDDLSPKEIVRQKTDLLATTVVDFVSRGESGQVHFQKGEITQVEAGILVGREALDKIYSWRRGYAFELSNEVPAKASTGPALRNKAADCQEEEEDAGEPFQRTYSVVSEDADDQASGLVAGIQT